MAGINFFKYILKILAIIFIVGFVVLNRQETTFYLSPLNDPLTLPMWLMGLVLFSVGFIIGALLLWLNSWPTRKDLKATKKQLKESEKDLEDLSQINRENQIKTLDDQ